MLWKPSCFRGALHMSVFLRVHAALDLVLPCYWLANLELLPLKFCQNGVMTANFDTETLIQEVQKRPELWDPSTEGYKDKNRKVVAWAEVCRVLVEDYEELSVGEKSCVGKDVNARWRSIRDSYAKDCKKRNIEIQSGSKGGKCRPYIFSKHLSFLKKVLDHKPLTNSPLSSQENKPETDSFSGTPNTKEWMDSTPRIFKNRQSAATSPGPCEKRQRLSFEDKMLRFLESYQQEKDDDDRAFFTSMLPAVRSLSEEQKFEFRIQVMQVLWNIKQCDSTLVPQS